jgi:CreA protein
LEHRIVARCQISSSGWWSARIAETDAGPLPSESVASYGLGQHKWTLYRRGVAMRIAGLAMVLLVCGALPGHAQTRSDSISTSFRWLGPNDKIVIERYDDPKVVNMSCYMSRADTGGIKGGLGLAEDPSRFSIACRAVGPVAIPSGLRKSEVIGFSSASLFFKTFKIHRAVDAEKMCWFTRW